MINKKTVDATPILDRLKRGVGTWLDQCVSAYVCEDYFGEKEKYRWHDLRVNENDLPEKDGCLSMIVLCTLKGGFTTCGVYCYESMSKKFYTRKLDGEIVCKYNGRESGHWYINGIMDDDVIAWRYIERFEDGDCDNDRV